MVNKLKVTSKVYELNLNDMIWKDDKLYFCVDTDSQKCLALFQSLDGDRFILEYEDTVEKLIEKIRGFEPVDPQFAEYYDLDEIVKDGVEYYKLPQRKTVGSSGYDFYSPIRVTIEPKLSFVLYTNVKAYMLQDEELLVSMRSGLASKGLMLLNPPGKIDSDYYSNETNDGNIGFILYNISDSPIHINKGDRIGQGTFYKYLIADLDNATGKRTGGFGSTGRHG